MTVLAILSSGRELYPDLPGLLILNADLHCSHHHAVLVSVGCIVIPRASNQRHRVGAEERADHQCEINGTSRRVYRVLRKYLNQNPMIFERFGDSMFRDLCKKQ